MKNPLTEVRQILSAALECASESPAIIESSQSGALDQARPHRPDEYLGNAFVQAAGDGLLDSYKLTSHEVFKHVEEHHYDIEIALACAIDDNYQEVANDLLDKVLKSPRGLSRDNILYFGLRSAASENNAFIAERILKEDLPIRYFEIPLWIVCSQDHTGIVAPIVESLMRKKEEDERYAAVTFKEEREALRYIQTQHGRVLGKSLKLSIQKKLHSTITILLPPYLECVTHSTDLNTAEQVLQGMDDKYITQIPRRLKLKFLSLQMPVEAKQNILRRLQWDSENDSIPKDALLSTGEQTFEVHKDVLAYWSPFFAVLFRGEWADRDHVRLDGNISAATLQEVVNFMYSGSYVYQDAQLDQLEDLLGAADYLDIESLNHQVEPIRSRLLYQRKKARHGEETIQEETIQGARIARTCGRSD